ncbi:MAG: isochorismatase family cysteine hydrolase [Erysipelotrichaceae bacterium]|nr:isochorismatase family cysteine hydrolase [Erysipelotrichaceae bacterium]
MNRILIVVDMQNDFVSGSLGTAEAKSIVDNVRAKLESFDGDVIFTRDTHNENYLKSNEGKHLPVEHCIKGSYGWEIIDELKPYVNKVIDKPTFGSTELIDYLKTKNYDSFELCGLCTDICVVSNALLIKANFYEAKVSVDSACCAGVTVESHNAALKTMQMCQIEVK